MIEQINFSNQYHLKIFNGKVFSPGSRSDNEYYKSIDPVNNYKVDKHGFRSELTKADVLVGGCSFTFGIGIPEDATWGRVVGRGLGSSVASIAVPGASISWIVEQIYIYFKTYGHPKKVFCLFPDLGRVPVMVDDIVLSEGGSGANHGDGFFTAHTSGRNSEEGPKYLKRPYPVNYVTTYDNAAYWSIRAIRSLEQYCSATGIDLLWSTWDLNFASLANQLNGSGDLKFDNYFDLYKFSCRYYLKENGINKQTIFDSVDKYGVCRADHVNIECTCGLSCHSELIDLYGPESFYLGADTLRGAEYAHPGVHLHAHYGEAFLKQLDANE